ASHEQTVRSMRLLPGYVPCRTVIISPRAGIDKLAVPHAGEMLYVSHADIVAVFDRASKAFEEVRAASPGNTDEALREHFLQRYEASKVSMQEVASRLQKTPLAGLPVKEG